MIQVDLRADMSVAFRAVDQVSGKMRARAVARALNRAATTVRAEARRSIRDRYQISAARVNRVLRIRQAAPGRLVSEVVAKDVRLPLASFSARTGNKNRVVSVKVLRVGARKQVRGNPDYAGTPFVQTLPSGHVGIFQRVGKKRLPIRELFTVAIPKAFVGQVIGRTLRRVAAERFNTELVRELAFRAGQGR